MKTVAEIITNMRQAIGTMKYIKHFSGLLVFTDGVDQLREDADCHWLVDAIAFYQSEHKDKRFQVWELETDTENHTAVLTMKEDSNLPVLVKQEIPYTDFPLEKIKFFVQEGGYGTVENWTTCLVLMLTSEY